jgi:hypothetical protein
MALVGYEWLLVIFFLLIIYFIIRAIRRKPTPPIASIPPPTSSPVVIREREVIKEVVMVPCRYCGGLMPQATTFCPNCGARRQ